MAKKNGRKKIRKIKPGKNLPEKISGKLWAENLPANLFEKKNPEKKKRESGRSYTGGISVPFQKGIYDSRRT